MRLYLIRHAIAEEREDFRKINSNDELRPLTEKGAKKFLRYCRKMESHLDPIDFVVSSPYIRATETADILIKSLGLESYAEAPELVPQSPPIAFAKWLRNHARTYKEVAAIGHEPFLSLFASYLLTGHELPILSFKKGGMACLDIGSFSEMGPRSAHLSWLICPKIFD